MGLGGNYCFGWKVKLLREFFVIFLGNSLLVLVAWRIYGARIRNKFMTVSGEP